MRNLKKLLALVLAMMMALSLMVTANATTTGTQFGDEYAITDEFVEAAEVLTGMKVFQGDNGSFRPASQITRGEVAALIYRLATGDTTTNKMDLYSTTTPFTDVQPTDWFAGYVGYCWNAGYIKGRTPDTFDPYGNVTGYEALAMVLRAMGYDQNGEFTGVSWTQRVASISQQRGLLDDIKSTNYATTLHMASRRDVVASILFQAAQKARVTYTPAYGYQTGDHLSNPGTITSAGRYSDYTPLGVLNFGLTKIQGNLLANQVTGESKSILSIGPSATIGSDEVTMGAYIAGSNNHYNYANGLNLNLETGLDLIGHKMKVWYNRDSGSNKTVYAYYDEATLANVVKADNTDLTGTNTVPAGQTSLRDAATSAGFGINNDNDAVFSNSFSRLGAPANTYVSSTDTFVVGTGVRTTGKGDEDGTSTSGKVSKADGYVSPVKMYALVSNNSSKNVDVVIALNVEVSKITESNTVNRVPTLGMPVENWGDNTALASGNGLGTYFVRGVKTAVSSTTGSVNGNLKNVNQNSGTDNVTGVIAQDAVKGNSTKALGDYEFGIHVTGTNTATGGRTVSDTEALAIDATGTVAKGDMETGYFMLSKVANTASGTVVAYNVTAGTVTLNDGTVLNRSKFYHTVVGHDEYVSNTSTAPETALPQSWTRGGTYWEEGYANVEYRFFLDYEGNYLGAERGTGSTFLYGTYLDYSQETSTSTFNYFLTGVNLNGEIETVKVNKFWDTATSTDFFTGTVDQVKNITGTDQLTIPFRDSTNGGQNNGIGAGIYAGFAISNGTVDGMNADNYTDRNEYLSNMARLGIKNADDTISNNAFNAQIDIDSTSVTLGAEQTSTTGTGSNKYFTEGTKFILVSGFGTDSVKAEVYNGISALKGSAAHVYLNMNYELDTTAGASKVVVDHLYDGVGGHNKMNQLTYYTESPYTYAQSGSTAMKVDTIILPKAAVSWSGGSGLYYVGDPNATLVNSWGIDAWKYTMYVDGEARQIWLTNQPGVTTPGDNLQLNSDAFYHLKETGDVANDGQPIYTAGHYGVASGETAGEWYAGTSLDASYEEYSAGAYSTYAQHGFISEAWYSATTRDAQTAMIQNDRSTYGSETETVVSANLYRVAEAKVVNLNVASSPNIGSTNGYIWPGITDLATLNQAGSINPVTGRTLRVSAVVDPTNPLAITTIYVCWDQNAG